VRIGGRSSNWNVPSASVVIVFVTCGPPYRVIVTVTVSGWVVSTLPKTCTGLPYTSRRRERPTKAVDRPPRTKT
jgi:hypothetical protein